MLSFQRSSNHPSSMMPWFAQPISDPRTTTTTAPSFWLQMSDGSANPLADSTSSSSTGSSCATSTKVPPPLASSSSTNSQIHSFYPSQNDIKTKQTRSTLRTVNTSAELNLPLGKNNSLVLTFSFHFNLCYKALISFTLQVLFCLIVQNFWKWTYFDSRSPFLVARRRPDLDPLHVRGPRLAGHRHRSLPDERQGPLSDDHRDVLPTSPARRKNALQRFPAQTVHGYVQLNNGQHWLFQKSDELLQY